MSQLFEAVASGKPLSALGTEMYMYGIYLSHGGTPEGYLQMDQDDLDMMYIAHSALEAHRHKRWMEGLVKIFQALFGRKE
jgi:hypothetical protein